MQRKERKPRSGRARRGRRRRAIPPTEGLSGQRQPSPHLVSTLSRAWAFIQALFPLQTTTNHRSLRAQTKPPLPASPAPREQWRSAPLCIPPGRARLPRTRATTDRRHTPPSVPAPSEEPGHPAATVPAAGAGQGARGAGLTERRAPPSGEGALRTWVSARVRARVCRRACLTGAAAEPGGTESLGADGLSPWCGRRPPGGPGSRQSPSRAAAPTRGSRSRSARRGRGGAGVRAGRERACPGAPGYPRARARVRGLVDAVRARPGGARG